MVTAKTNNLDSSTSETADVQVPTRVPPDELQPDTAQTEMDMTVKEISADQIDDIFRELKTLLSTVEKLQKARQEVGDIKPMLLRLLDGELLEEEELEQLKSGVSGLSKLVKLYSDYQSALDRAQPARILLDQVIKR